MIVELVRIYNEEHFVNFRSFRNEEYKNIKTIYFESELTLNGEINNEYKKINYKLAVNDEIYFIDTLIINELLQRYNKFFLTCGFISKWHIWLCQTIFILSKSKQYSTDIFVYSDIDELLFSHDLAKIEKLDLLAYPFRVGQKFNILSPYFEYKSFFPGPYVINQNIIKENSIEKLSFILQKRDEYVLYDNNEPFGVHMTYLGQIDSLKKKIKNVVEYNDKIVILSRMIGVYLIRFGFDPFLRKPYRLNIVYKSQIHIEIKKYYTLNFVKPYFYFLRFLVNKF